MTTDQFKRGQEIVNKVIDLSKKIKQLETIDEKGIKSIYIESLSNYHDNSFRVIHSPNNEADGIEHQPENIQVLFNVTIKMMIEYYKKASDALEAEFNSI